jgi:hypothetical protein
MIVRYLIDNFKFLIFNFKLIKQYGKWSEEKYYTG